MGRGLRAAWAVHNGLHGNMKGAIVCMLCGGLVVHGVKGLRCLSCLVLSRLKRARECRPLLGALGVLGVVLSGKPVCRGVFF